ncbi:c2h2 finger domain containing protein [Ophiocordyceps sinensis CO18]|uniref:C2h2 finger domain containing protein n=1 Tax=Ophiocordyceps sinensis (strain Co18 / CGMCC 3.14243) TaxID=911162 RepID=T5ALY6_OPHSC|nr:c2h2 finger domain containing protein [Ophiocordyceps sinensis CO18]
MADTDKSHGQPFPAKSDTYSQGLEAYPDKEESGGTMQVDHPGLLESQSHLQWPPRPIEQRFSALSVEESALDVRKPDVQFNPAQCLFCSHRSPGLDENMDHMLKKHSLVVPDPDRLAVDLETLIEYFHLVVHGYFECLFCGSQRRNIEAAQQHMIGKGHCKIDISSQASEYRDFYEFEPSIDDDITELADGNKSIRLPSGKVLSHRAEARTRVPRSAPVQEAATSSPCATTLSTLSQDTTPRSKRVAKRDAVFQTHLATLRDSDRRSLMHLPAAQQRAVVMRGKKQVEQARRDENEMLLKIQLKANRSIKK